MYWQKRSWIVYAMIIVSLIGGFILSRKPQVLFSEATTAPLWTNITIEQPTIHFQMPGTPTHSITVSETGQKVGTFVSAWPESTHFLVKMTEAAEKNITDEIRATREIDTYDIANGIYTKGKSFYDQGFLFELFMVYPEGYFSEEQYHRFISSFTLAEPKV